MRPRLPLSAKILVWCFLNCAALAAVVILLFNAQFHVNLNWLLSSSAHDRVNALHDLVAGELANTAPEEWDRVVERYGEAYHVRLSLFDDSGNRLVGSLKELPNEIRARFAATPFQHTPSPATKNPGASPASPAQSPERRGPLRRRPLRDLIRSTHPTEYWLLVSMRVDNVQTGPMRVVLVANDYSLSMGGLIIDLAPWLRLGLGAVGFSVLFWFPLLRGITRSIAKISEATSKIAEGRFDVRVSLRRRDELGALAEAINQMAARLDGLVKGQKRFLGDVAHELCSPLAKLQMALGILEERTDANQKNYVVSATEKAAQISSLVNELLVFSKASLGPSTVQLKPENIKRAAEEAVQREASGGEEIRIEIAEHLSALADHDLLVRALSNLLRNAIRHSPEPGSVSIVATPEENGVVIKVIDSGPGVPEQELPKIFDAFYRVDPSRTRDTGGIGLGLTIVKTCIESCHGTIKAGNRSPRGLEISIRLSI